MGRGVPGLPAQTTEEDRRIMKGKITNLKGRLHLAAVVILLAGLGSALAIYLTAANDAGGVLGYEAAGGYVYPLTPEDSKMYLHDLELYGGKANVLADELLRWFAGLWHGKTLAFTVAFITILLSFGTFFLARHMPSGGHRGGAQEE